MSIIQDPEAGAAQVTIETAVDAAPNARPRWRRVPVLPIIAGLWLVVLLAAAIFADVLPISKPGVPAGDSAMPPFQAGGDLILGTDRLGRSELSRIVYGARTSLTLGVAATGIGILVGGLLGVVAGYFRGRVDATISAVANMILALPTLMLLLGISAVLTPSLKSILAGLGIVAIPIFMRIARAATLSLAQREFVTAARAMGAGHVRIMRKELVPSVLVVMSSYAFLLVAVFITAEGSLSYLGVGVPPPNPSWGVMIADGQRDLRTNAYLMFVPAFVMFLTVFALNILGDLARRLVNVREEVG